MTSSVIIIPARIDSKRFPEKPLCDLGGKTMIRRVYERCIQSGFDTYVATDSRRVAHEIPYEHVIYDNADYDCGTSRVSGAVKLKNLKYDRIINVQGDMPDVTVEMIKTVDRILSMNYTLATLFTRMDENLQNDPNSVKLVTDNSGKALWFGRGLTGYGEHHLGVYGYQRKVLEQYPHLDKHIEEDVENLEQLRWLKSGLHMQCGMVKFDGIEINTPEDMEKWNESR